MEMQEERRVERPHTLTLTGRERARLTGVNAVNCFNEEEVVLTTSAGEVALVGAGLHIEQLNLEDGQLDVTFDCRYPVFFDDKTICETVKKRLAPAGFAMDPTSASHPHHVPESSELVQKLMAVYNGIMGVEEKPFAIGGGTYARHLKEGVAFGMLFPGDLELEHQANESIDLKTYIRAARIYAYAIAALCGEEN